MSMHPFDQQLVTKFSRLTTPFYYYDLDLLRSTCLAIQKEIAGFPFHVHYALKSNFNDRILKIIKDFGFGADCVSGNEVKKAIEIGFSADHVVFAGVGKADWEIDFALKQDIFAFNVESLEELVILNDLAKTNNKRARYALRINPNVDAGTHEYITTGTLDNKFGIDEVQFWTNIELIKKLSHVEFIGIHYHIGSQITDLSRFADLIEKSNVLVQKIKDVGFRIQHLNVGGGLGIDYHQPDQHPIPDFKSYFDLFKKHLQLDEDQQLHFELGRSITGQCGTLVSKVLYQKPGQQINFLILDAGMTELIRPALYKAHHAIQNLSSTEQLEKYHVVGPICESSDAFAKNIKLPMSKRGDIIAIRSAGAYGEVMRSHYNLRESAPAYYSDDMK